MKRPLSRTPHAAARTRIQDDLPRFSPHRGKRLLDLVRRERLHDVRSFEATLMALARVGGTRLETAEHGVTRLECFESRHDPAHENQTRHTRTIRLAAQYLLRRVIAFPKGQIGCLFKALGKE
jgi:hypothetical protein